MPDLDRSKDYKDVKGSKIRLKETKSEKAHKIYRREQAKISKENDRISRANGYAVSPPRQASIEPISPPRNPSKRKYDPLEDDEGEGGDGEWMGGLGRKSKEELERKEFQDKLYWMSRSSFDQDTSFFETFEDSIIPSDINIPKRFRDIANSAFASSSFSFSSSSTSTSSSSGGAFYTKRSRRGIDEIHLSGGTVPPLGSMTDEEYTEWIRDGMYKKKHRSEIEQKERIRKDKEEKQRLKEIEREKEAREEEKRIKKLKKQKGLNEERKRKEERIRWVERWKILSLPENHKDNDIIELNMSFNDIPWPIQPSSSSSSSSIIKPTSITSDDLTIDNIRLFVNSLAEDKAINEEHVDIRKMIRDLIKNYHPDRFNSRILTRVKDKDKDKVQEAVVLVSGILNDLVREVR
ncbi:uncharacterized protein L201_001458 [Kwoniella dendrophila CBS 6074]|uniref:J domain-containing protein n=1 Tax=Kwoniella dendrophila CBS 6074 TaxID=1295534 RepID=A0AAX4JMD3_9TREE